MALRFLIISADHFVGGGSPKAPPTGLTLAVCGAHMSGLPLNHQLTERGGVFLRAAKTSDAYRLYALAGGPPERPGLVRGAPGSGAAITVELWTLPLETVGSFLAGIPSPLGLGTVVLSDGSTVQGFVCESIAADTATDITSKGTWRNHIAS